VPVEILVLKVLRVVEVRQVQQELKIVLQDHKVLKVLKELV
jgi:hypothetical protein